MLGAHPPRVTAGSFPVGVRPIAYEVKCSGMRWWRTCKKHSSKRVRALVSYTTEPDEYVGTFGVITAFCVGMTRCPGYVKNAVNVR